MFLFSVCKASNKSLINAIKLENITQIYLIPVFKNKAFIIHKFSFKCDHIACVVSHKFNTHKCTG